MFGFVSGLVIIGVMRVCDMSGRAVGEGRLEYELLIIIKCRASMWADGGSLRGVGDITLFSQCSWVQYQPDIH